jgi:hypothetical protein
MARVDITNTKLKLNEISAMPETEAVTNQTDGCAIDYTGKDDGKILLILENSTSSPIDIKILQGNGIQGVEDLAINIGNMEKKVIVIESGKFVNVKGELKGKVIINGSTSLKVAAIELP